MERGCLVPDDLSLALYRSHRRKLMDYARGIVGDAARAEDVVQEAFLRFRDAAAGRVLEEPVGFLYRVVRNLALDRRRRLVLEGRHGADAGDPAVLAVAGDQASPEQDAMAREQLARVMEAMDELPERTRIALEMHRLGGCTLREIAARLGVSVSMAQVLVTDGVRHCMARL